MTATIHKLPRPPKPQTRHDCCPNAFRYLRSSVRQSGRHWRLVIVSPRVLANASVAALYCPWCGKDLPR